MKAKEERAVTPWAGGDCIHALEADLAARREGPPGPRYYQSGEIHPELDDQAITP